MKQNDKQKLLRDKLKKSVIDGKTSMYGRERTDEEKFLLKQKIIKLYADDKGI